MDVRGQKDAGALAKAWVEGEKSEAASAKCGGRCAP